MRPRMSLREGHAGGFHLVWLDPQEVRDSFAASIGTGVYALLEEGTHKIAQLELSMVLYGLPARASHCRRR